MDIKIKNTLSDEAQVAYLHSMSNFLHVMKTTITADIKNPIENLLYENDIESVRRSIKEDVYPAALRMFSLCELINALESIMTAQSENAVKERLLKTDFFKSETPDDLLSLMTILEECKTKKKRRSGYAISFVNTLGDCEVKALIGIPGIFGTKLLHEMVFSLMLEVVLSHTKINDDDEYIISISHESGIMRMSGEHLDAPVRWNGNLIGTDQFKLFHLLFSYIGLGEFNIRTESELVFVEFICG